MRVCLYLNPILMQRLLGSIKMRKDCDIFGTHGCNG